VSGRDLCRLTAAGCSSDKRAEDIRNPPPVRSYARTPTAHGRRAWAAGRSEVNPQDGPGVSRGRRRPRARRTTRPLVPCRRRHERSDGHALPSPGVCPPGVPLRAWAPHRAWIPGTSPAPQTPIASEPTPAFGAGYRRLSVARRALATDESRQRRGRHGRTAPLALWHGPSAVWVRSATGVTSGENAAPQDLSTVADALTSTG
jgi:hypothetical protein